MKHYVKWGALLMVGISATAAPAQSNYEAELAARHKAKLQQGRQVGKEIWKHKTGAERANFYKRMTAMKEKKGLPVSALRERAKP
jgi:hypothetical protein